MIPSYRKDSLEQHYKIINQLGKGAMGITYAAEDVNTGQKIALKVISLQNLSDAKHLELLEREVAVLKQLNHPNIPQYIDYFQLKEDNKLYLVQELVLGKNLNQQVESGLRLTEGEVKNIAQQVLYILDYLHNFQPSIIHRDIKPHNLILGDDGKIFLVDFGAVHNAYYNTMIGGTVGIGTIGYMSPEQQIGKPVPASDLYSLGRTLLYLLTNRPPDHLLAHKETVNLDHIRDYIQLSDEFIQWLEKILDPDVDERFYSAKEALNSLKNTKSINKEKNSQIGWFALICLGVASVTLGTFSYNYRWLILNSLGFSAPAKVCWDKDITKEYFKSVGNLAKGNYNKDICGYFLDSLIGEYKTGDKGNKEIIKFLIDHGVNMNSTFKAEQPTLLERLVRSRDMEIIELLISGNDGVNTQDAYGSIALHYAAKEGDTKVIELLINHGADVNVQDNDGRTPLHYAAQEENKETIELLINHGADVNVQDNDGNTPLNHAEWRKHREIIVLLKKHGAR